MSYTQKPKSDIGTVAIHWLIVVTLVGAALSGLAIASVDNPGLPIVNFFSFLLPQDNVWFLHLTFAIGLIASLAAYAIYIRRANITDRIRFAPGRMRALILGGRPRWSSVNLLLYWFLFAALAIELGAGILLYLGWGETTLFIHLHCTWLLLIFPVLHIAAQLLYGGINQVLRVFRPQWRLPQRAPPLMDALIERIQLLETKTATPANEGGASKESDSQRPFRKPATLAVPLAIAAAAGIAVIPLSTTFDGQTRQILKIVKVEPGKAPALDGDLSNPEWRRAPVASVLTEHGANLENGESRIDVRALHDDEFAYFAFSWTDPTRSIKHMPLVKARDGWRLMRSAAPGNEALLHEDKLAVLLLGGGRPLLGAGFHFGKHPISDKPQAATGRGLHYVAGGLGDIWQWRAAHGGMTGWIDNGHFAAPLQSSAESPLGRYTGGFSLDPNPGPYQDNFDILFDREAYPSVRPRRFPKAPVRMAGLQTPGLDAEKSDPEDLRAWLTIEDSEPYSDERDRATPVGTVIPSIILMPRPLARSTDISGAARWAGGRWCLEVKRRLDTGSRFDVAIKTGAFMWLAAFDHVETWHTYHVRPLQLELE
jgi:hypothetical protein